MAKAEDSEAIARACAYTHTYTRETFILIKMETIKTRGKYAVEHGFNFP